MLSTTIDRSPMSRRVRVAIAATLGAAAVTIAAAQGPFATFSGSITDPLNGTLANATLVLTNTQNSSKYEVRSDQAGHFEFVGLPPGDYLLQASFTGFSTLRGTLTVSGQNVQRDLTLKVGSLEETLTVRAGPSVSVAVRPESIAASVRRRSADCKPSATGGTLTPPVKLEDVRPQYPPHLASAGIGGVVVLDSVIAPDGTMKDVHVVTSVHPDLDAAAVEAVRQWRFSETLLNCVPVEVSMTATIRFMQ
jgi:protein TonB